MGRSLPYDLLRLLAHGAISTGGQVLGEMLTLPMKEKSAMRQNVFKSALGGASTLSEEGMQSLNEWIGKTAGSKYMLPSYGAPTGKAITPGGESLAMTPTPEALQSGAVSPEMEQRIVRPEASLPQILAEQYRNNPEIAHMAALTKSGMAPTAGQDQAMELRKTLADQADTTKKYLGDMHNAYQRDALDIREKLGTVHNDNQRLGIENAAIKAQQVLSEKVREFEKKVSMGESKQEEAGINSIHNKMLNLIEKAYPVDKKKKINPATQYELLDEYNRYYDQGVAKNPKAFEAFSRIPISKEPGKLYGTNYNIGDRPQNVMSPSGGAPSGPAATPSRQDDISKLKSAAAQGNKIAQDALTKIGESWTK